MPSPHMATPTADPRPPRDNSDDTDDVPDSFPSPDALSALVQELLTSTRRAQANARRQKIRENLARAAAPRPEIDPAANLAGAVDALRTVRRVSAPNIKMQKVQCPPSGLAWVRLHNNMKVTESYEHDFHVPYLGESDERIQSSNLLAEDLIEAEDGDEGNDSEFDDGLLGDVDMENDADHEPVVVTPNPQRRNDVRATRQKISPLPPKPSPARIRKVQHYKASFPVWDRAAKRVTLKAILDALQLSNVDKIASIVRQVFRLRTREMVDSYFNNIQTRLRLWKDEDDNAERVRMQNAEILKHARGEVTTSAFDVLKSYSIPYFICRQCYTYCCVMHGTQAPRLLKEPRDGTRKDELPQPAATRIEENCADRDKGGCWCRQNSYSESLDWVKEVQETEIWKDVKAILEDLFPLFGHDPCRVTAMLRVGLPKIDESVRFTCSRVGSLCEMLFIDQIAKKTSTPANRTVKRRRGGKKSAKGKTRPPQEESAAMKGGCRLDYYPCHHEGPCTKKVCACVQSGVLCEKYCGCNHSRALNEKVQITCNNAFAGCQCKSAIACNSNACICFSQGRECDPDRCRTCLDCKHDADGQRKNWNCRNVGLRMNYHQRTLAGHSVVHGWGVFAAQDIAKNEIIGEYVGEVIEQQDAERRGRIYDEVQYSFLFNITQSCALDSTRLGNKLRYCNHSPTPNCEPKVMRVGGDVRVGIYAKRDIAKNEELFFNYGYKNDVPYDWAQPCNKVVKPRKKGKANGIIKSQEDTDEDEVLPVRTRTRSPDAGAASLRATPTSRERIHTRGGGQPTRVLPLMQELRSGDEAGASEDDVVPVNGKMQHRESIQNGQVLTPERSVWRSCLKRVTVGAADVASPRRRVTSTGTPDSVPRRPRDDSANDEDRILPNDPGRGVPAGSSTGRIGQNERVQPRSRIVEVRLRNGEEVLTPSKQRKIVLKRKDGRRINGCVSPESGSEDFVKEANGPRKMPRRRLRPNLFSSDESDEFDETPAPRSDSTHSNRRKNGRTPGSASSAPQMNGEIGGRGAEARKRKRSGQSSSSGNPKRRRPLSSNSLADQVPGSRLSQAHLQRRTPSPQHSAHPNRPSSTRDPRARMPDVSNPPSGAGPSRGPQNPVARRGEEGRHGQPGPAQLALMNRASSRNGPHRPSTSRRRKPEVIVIGDTDEDSRNSFEPNFSEWLSRRL